MSTIDNRIVRMQFDNAQFEAGVSRSMATLDKLNEKLEFKGAEKGTSVLQRAMERVDLSKIESALDQLTSRFSTIGTAWGRVVENMVDKAMTGFKKLEQATLGQIKTGGWSRAMNLANAQFTIEGLKMDWNEMLKAINYGVQDTAYGLDSAAKAAASLAASGVAYQESVENANDSLMHTSLRAISGVAAMTNSSYDDIANVFTKVAGNGRLMGDDLQRLSSRGMNAAATLAEAFNTTEAKIRDMVSKGDISFQMFAEAMDSAFGEHAKEANKTFQGALSNMKAALSRVGAIFATPVINKTNVLFIALKSRIGEVQSALSDLTEEFEENGKKVKKVVEERFATHFAQAWEAAMNAAVKMVEAIDLSWIQSIADAMDRAAVKATDWFNRISDFFGKAKEETTEFAETADISVSDTIAAFEILFNGKYGSGKARIKALEAAGHDAKKVQQFIDEFVRSGKQIDKLTMSVAGTSAEDLAEYYAEISKNGYQLTKTNVKLGTSFSGVSESSTKVWKSMDQLTKDARLTQTFKNLTDSANYIKKIVVEITGTVSNFAKAVFDSFSKYIDPLAASNKLVEFLSDVHKNAVGLVKFWSEYQDGTEAVTDALKHLGETAASSSGSTAELSHKMSDMLDSLDHWGMVKTVVDNLTASLAHVIAVGKNLAKAAINIAKAIFKAFVTVFDPVGASSNIEGLTGSFEHLSEGLVTLSEKVAPIVEGAFTVMFSTIQAVTSVITRAVTAVTNFIAGLLKGKDAARGVNTQLQKTSDTVEKTGSIFDTLVAIFTKFADGIKGIPDILDELFTKLSQNQGVIRLKTAISDLWKIAKDSIKNALNPFSSAIGQMDDTAEKSSGVDSVVTAIGWIADKLASFIEKIPGWITTIENFAKTVKESIVGLIDDISNRIDQFKSDHPSLDAAFQVSDDSIESVADESKFKKVLDRVTTFAADIGKAIKDGLSSVNWKEIAGIGLIVAAILELYQLQNLTKDIRAIPQSISGMFGAFKGVAKGITGFFEEASKLVKYAGIVSVITAIVSAVLVITGSIYVLGTMDADSMYRGLSALVVISLVIGALIKLSTRLLDAKGPSTKIGNGAQSILSNFRIGLSSIGEIALLLMGISAMLRAVTKSLKDLDDVKNVSVNALALGGIIFLLSVAIVAIIKYLGDVQAELGNSNKLALTLGALSFVIGAIAGALIAISVAIKILSSVSTSGKGWAAVGMIVVIMVILVGGIRSLSKAIEKIDPKKTLSVVALMVVLVLAVVAIAGIMTLLVGEFAILLALPNGLTAIGTAFGAVVLIIGMIALGIGRIAETVSKVNDVGKIIGIILSMTLMIGVIAIALGVLSTLKGASSGKMAIAAVSMAGIVAVIAAALGILAAVMKKKDIKANDLLKISLAIVAMAGAVLLLAAAIALMTEMMAQNPEAAMNAMIGLAVFLGLFGGLMAILAGFGGDKIADAFIKIGGGFALLGASVALVGLGLLLVAKALTIIAPILPTLIVATSAFLTVLEEHWPILLAITVVIALIIVAVIKLSSIVVPIIKGIVELVTIAVKSVGELLASGAKKLGTWFSGLKTKTKLVIVGLIASMCSALLESGPNVLKTIGKLILMVLDWAADGIPKVVEKLVVLIIKLINGLADSINRHVNSIAAALWSVVGAIINTLAAVIKEGLIMLLGEKLGGKIADWLGLENGQKALTQKIKEMRADAERADAEISAILDGDEDFDYESAFDDAAKSTSSGGHWDSKDAKDSGEKAGGLFSKGFNIGADSEMGMSDIVAKAKNSANLSALGNEGGKDFGTGFNIGAASNMGMSDVVAMAGGGELGDIGAMKADDFMDGYSFEMASPSNINTVEDAANEGYVEPVKTQLDELEPAATDATHRAVDGMITALWEDRKDFQGMFHNQYVTMPIKMMTGKNGWDEHSPSHVFQHIAEYAVMGLMRGFDGQSEHLGSSVSSLSDQVIKSFGDPLARIGAMANGEIEYDPSIRPVLDSSNIAAGAGDINSLFRNQNVSLSGLSGRLAADLGEVTANNADIVDELVALRSDMADMTDRMSNLQVVMNNGALVGAIAGDMDAALGQRTNFRRRGN